MPRVISDLHRQFVVSTLTRNTVTLKRAVPRPYPLLPNLFFWGGMHMRAWHFTGGAHRLLFMPLDACQWFGVHQSALIVNATKCKWQGCAHHSLPRRAAWLLVSASETAAVPSCAAARPVGHDTQGRQAFIAASLHSGGSANGISNATVRPCPQ